VIDLSRRPLSPDDVEHVSYSRGMERVRFAAVMKAVGLTIFLAARAALRRGSYSGYWTNKSAEKQFGPAGPNGILEGDGAPRWKQRAFYDMVKDMASLVYGIALARISVWDKVHLEDKTTKDVRSILECDKISSPMVEALKKLIHRRLRIDTPRLATRKRNRVRDMLAGLSPEERKRKMEYWCPDLSGQLVIIDKDGTVLVDPQKGINLLQERNERENADTTRKTTIDIEKSITSRKKELKPGENSSTDFVRIIPAHCYSGFPAPFYRPYAFYADAASLENRTIADCYILVKALGVPPAEYGNDCSGHSAVCNGYCDAILGRPPKTYSSCSTPFIGDSYHITSDYDTPLADTWVMREKNDITIFEKLPLSKLKKLNSLFLEFHETMQSVSWMCSLQRGVHCHILFPTRNVWGHVNWNGT